MAALKAAGLAPSDVAEAPGFIKDVSLEDPSRNRIEIVEYSRDPLVAV